MPRYETLMVLHPELPDAQMRETIDRARRLIEQMEGTTDQIQEWGMRDLAYPIRKVTRGYYVLAEYSASPAVVVELERNLRIADEVLRYITVSSSGVRRGEQRPKSQTQEEESDAGSEGASADELGE